MERKLNLLLRSCTHAPNQFWISFSHSC